MLCNNNTIYCYNTIISKSLWIIVLCNNNTIYYYNTIISKSLWIIRSEFYIVRKVHRSKLTTGYKHCLRFMGSV